MRLVAPQAARKNVRVITADDYLLFVDEVLDDMVRIVTELGDELANQRPDVPDSNSPYAILTHCLGVMEYWGGYMVAGRIIQRDRAAEFLAAGPVGQLVERTRRARRQLQSDLANLQPLGPPRGHPKHQEDAGLPMHKTQGGALIHAYEDLARHRGQMEITRDMIRVSVRKSGRS
jgi:hypothetical protein